MRILILLAASILLNISCAPGQASAKTEGKMESEDKMKQEVTKLEELIHDELKMIKSYDNKPAYYLQINKSGCRLLVSVDDIPLGYPFVEDDGETMFYPINDVLLGSGEHRVRIDVYPRTWEDEISKEAWVNIKVCYYAQKSEGQVDVLTEITTPNEIGTYKLPLFTDSLTFNATLPFDFKYILANAKDLRKVTDLEDKVVAHYNKVRQMMADGDYYGYNKMRLSTTWPLTEMSYLGEKQLRKTYINTDKLFRFMCKPNTCLDREILPIQDYEMIVCGNGKLVYLRRKAELDQILRVMYYNNEEHKEVAPDKKSVAYKFIALYMPADSDELVELY